MTPKPKMGVERNYILAFVITFPFLLVLLQNKYLLLKLILYSFENKRYTIA